MPSPLVGLEKPRPWVITASVTLWLSSALAGAVIFVYFSLRLDAVRELVDTAIREEDPTADASTVEAAVNSTLIICLGLLFAAVTGNIVLALFMAVQRNWARVLLAIVGVLTAPLTLVVATVLTAGTVESREYLLIPLAAQATLMLAGLVTMFLPASNRWLRSRLAP